MNYFYMIYNIFILKNYIIVHDIPIIIINYIRIYLYKCTSYICFSLFRYIINIINKSNIIRR